MAIVFFLILVSLIVASGFLLAYLWATRSGQFDDSYTSSVRMLFDDELITPSKQAEGANEESETKTNLS